MITVFRYTLRRYRGQIIGWGIGLALLGLLLVSMFDSIGSQADALNEYLEVFPEEFTAFFGDFSDFGTPEGFVGVEFFSYMPIIIGIFAVMIGSGMLVSDEENGTLDLILAYPVSRTALFTGRVLAFIVTSVMILGLAWVGLAIPMSWSSMTIDLDVLALPFVSLLAQIMIFGAVSLLFSMLLPSRGMASMAGGLLLVASFFITGLAKIDDTLETVAQISPLNYYQAREAFDGLNGTWVAGILGVSLGFIILAWLLFRQRDIRVGGEGGWRLSLPSLRRGAQIKESA
jgi:ABC-2 type transport system permease protein